MVMKEAVLTLAVLALLVPSGFAQTQAMGGIVGAGVTPDNPFWGADLAMERLELMFNRDPLARARLAIKYREERVAEAEAMVNKQNFNAMGMAMKNYEERGKTVEESIASSGARPGMSEFVMRVDDHRIRMKAKEQTLLQVTPPQAQPQVKAAFEKDDTTVGKAEDEAREKNKEAERAVKEWLRNQERAYGMDGGISLVSIYEGLTSSGKAPEGQLGHAVKWYNAHYQLPESFTGRIFVVRITKNGVISDSMVGTVVHGKIEGVRSPGIMGESNMQVTLVIPSENIQTYIGHMMANDRLAMAGDLREIGAGKDLVALAGLI